MSKSAEYVLNKCTMLFNMVPGDDEYNPKMGLNLQAKRFQSYVDGSRDHDYESEIVKQFTTYTDIIPLNVVAMSVKSVFVILMTITYSNEIYQLETSSKEDELSLLINKINS